MFFTLTGAKCEGYVYQACPNLSSDQSKLVKTTVWRWWCVKALKEQPCKQHKLVILRLIVALQVTYICLIKVEKNWTGVIDRISECSLVMSPPSLFSPVRLCVCVVWAWHSFPGSWLITHTCLPSHSSSCGTSPLAFQPLTVRLLFYSNYTSPATLVF